MLRFRRKRKSARTMEGSEVNGNWQSVERGLRTLFPHEPGDLAATIEEGTNALGRPHTHPENS